MSENLILKNPHSVIETIRFRPKDVIRVILPDVLSDPWREVKEAALRNKISIQALQQGDPRKNVNSKEGGRESHPHALAKAKPSVANAKELFSNINPQGKDVWIALDCLTDPQNVGAIFRTASFFNVRGVLMTNDRSSSLTSTVYDIASGGVEHIPFFQATNLAQAIEHAKKEGLWILGTSEHAKSSWSEIKPDRNWLLIVGNEEKGMRRLTQDLCDLVCAVPAKGKVTSLNVASATSILISKLLG